MYQNEVWDLIVNFFLAFNIQFLPREGNRMVESLLVVVSSFRPPQNSLLRYEVEVRYRLSIPNNVKHGQVFKDDKQVKRFIEFNWEFSHSTINQEEEEENQEATLWKDTVFGPKILQLKGNTIPCGLVPLERLFNKENIVSKTMAPEIDNQVED